jgi:predicted small metal-binding protein
MLALPTNARAMDRYCAFYSSPSSKSEIMRGVCSHVKRSTTFTSPQRRASTKTLINTIEIENVLQQYRQSGPIAV